jgi:hypothetical protein
MDPGSGCGSWPHRRSRRPGPPRLGVPPPGESHVEGVGRSHPVPMMPPPTEAETVAVDGWEYLMETITRREPVTQESSTAPWPAFGMIMTVLVAGAFATGWHFGRRWAHVMGW